MATPMCCSALLLSMFLCPAQSTISDSFRNFVGKRFGQAVANLLARDDLGVEGSYGGGEHVSGEKTDQLPVIFVHGLLMSAGTTQPIAAFFKSSGGYSDKELFATSYGPKNSLILNAAMDCQFSQALRYLIIAVGEFTNSQVNVVAYSLGVPIVRKAMLGGSCVDGGELGSGSLTRYVHTFLAIGGPNHGVPACSFTVALRTNSCNAINGLRCNSRFLLEINSKQHYEGQIVYVMQSTGDQTVGNLVCGVQTTGIPGADYTLTFEGLSHHQLLTLTAQQQFNLITKHSVN